jgi:hypothetical protein
MTGCLIECCEVHDNGDCGVGGSQTQGIKWNNVSESEIRDCKVYNQCGDPTASGPPGSFGIYLCGGDDNEWHHNEVYDTHKAGIFLRCSPWRAHIHHNYVHHNPFAGIRCQCVNDRDFTVEYNYCYNNRGAGSGSWAGGYGIFFGGANADPNCCRYNVCKNNFVGISFERESWCGYLYENTACQNIDDNDVTNDINVQDGAVVTGDCNTCDFATGYDDTSATSGCLYACGEQPTAGFSATQSVPGTIEFTDSSTPGNQGDSIIDYYYWDFGDCSDPGTSMDQNPSHTYAKAGTYTVCHSVTDNKECQTGCPCDTPPGVSGLTEGRRDTVCQQVVVQEPTQEQSDLVISEKSEEWIDPADPLQGYRVKFTVKNQGTGSANASVTCLTIDGTPAGDDQDCTALGSGETHNGIFEGPFTCSGDNDTIEVCADCNDEVTEGNEGNNCKENDWTCPAVSKPDLVITAKSEEWIDPADPSQGYKVYYTVKNQGTGSADASATCLTIDGTASGTDQACTALDPGETHSGTFEGPFTCSGDSDTVEVCADCTSQVDESDEDNNCKENEWACSGLIFDIRNGIGEPGCTDRTVNVSLKNSVSITGIQVDICNGGGCLSLADVELTERSSGFSVEFQDDYPESGCARIILYSTTGALIGPGDGPVVILHYDVDSTATGSCVDLTSDNLFITDEYDEPLTASKDPGSFFLGIYGDPWPYDNGIVGDGQVNIHDVVRDVQISLETYTPTDCEFVAGDVPTGFGVNCQAPDEQIDIRDVLEMVAKILARDNCIDSY